LAEHLAEFHDDDVVMFSDVDEIGKRDVVSSFRTIPAGEIISTTQSLYFYYCNMKAPGLWFPGPRALTLGTLRKNGNSFDLLRSDKMKNCQPRLVSNVGWHFSYMGGKGTVAEKIRCAPDQSDRIVRSCADYGHSVTTRRVMFDLETTLSVVMDMSTLPAALQCPEFSHLVYPVRAVEMEECRRMSCCDMAMHNRLFGINELIHDNLPYPWQAHVVEVGSYEGVSTEFFSLFCRQVDAIDPYLPCFNQETPEMLLNAEVCFREVLARRPNIRHIRETSEIGLGEFPENSVDLVYLDGNHGEQAVMDDIRNALRIIKPGGCLSGHDYAMLYTISGIDKMIGKPDKLYSDTSWSWTKR
jgi:hypothetical protein